MENRVWFVTGASSGIGLALAKMLCARGERVAATSRNGTVLQERLGASSSSLLPLQVDITDEEQVRDALKQTIEHFGRLDVLVNNAGYAQTGAVEELSDAEIRGQFDINVFAVFNVLRHGIPYLRKQDAGYIFNIASIAGFKGFDMAGAYCASKFAVDGISHTLASELKRFGIRVVGVKPGAIETNFFNALTDTGEPIDAYRHDDSGDSTITKMLPVDVVAKAIIDASEEPEPPVDLFIGQDAYAAARNRIKDTLTDIARTEARYDL
ncbi:MAG: SDR family NAD(P)-dependent oxidoreductase [Serratia liquefaciens]|jgi:NAD(P)-dependent dehydrogenase (short-subunit alcohol dehydrogenase family)